MTTFIFKDEDERKNFEKALNAKHRGILKWVIWFGCMKKYVHNPHIERHLTVYSYKAYPKIVAFYEQWQKEKA